MKKQRISMIILTTLFLSSCDMDCISPEGDVIKQSHELESFSKINIECSADVVLTQSDSIKVVVETEENIHDRVEISVINGELIVDMKGCVINSNGVTVYVQMPEIKRLTVDGSGSFKSTNTFVQNIPAKLVIDGSGDINLAIENTQIEAEIDGSGDINLSGKSQTLKAFIDGSGDIEASELMVETGSVHVDGSGDVRVNAKKELTIDIDGSGDVYYQGDPDLTDKDDGSGSIKKL